MTIYLYFRRMLLHRELHEEEINKLSKIKYPLNTSHSDNKQVDFKFNKIENT